MTPTDCAPYRSLYTYAWDIADIGVSAFVEQVLAMGIRDICLATSYHAGKFIRPHAQQAPRVIFPEDGVVYFEPHHAQYGQLQAQAHSDPALRAVLGDLIADGRLRVHGWTVLLHNSRLGRLYPELCSQNAFGDRYIYSLCPMQDAVFDYAIHLCRDLSSHYALASLVLETPGWLPYGHGYHHEFAQIALSTEADQLLGLCFCDACKHAAIKQDIAIDDLQQQVQQVLNRAFSPMQFETTDQSAANLRARTLFKDEHFIRFMRLRQNRVSQLVRTLRESISTETTLSVIPTVQRPTAACWTEGSDLFDLAQVSDFLEIPFYERTAQAVIDDARSCLAQGIKPQQIRAILRPGLPDLKQGRDLEPAIMGLKQLGIHHFGFYNYGLLPQSQLDHLAQVLQNQETLHAT